MDFFKELNEWLQALSETENETVIFLLKTVLPVSITMFGFFASGLLLAYLIWAPYLKRLNAAREDNLMLTGRLNEIIEDQNVLLASLNEVHGVEKEKWHLKIATREDRLQSLNGRLAELDADSSEIRAELISRDDKIELLHREVEKARSLEAETISQLEIKENQIEGLKRDLSPGGALGKRVHELEGLLRERDSELERINQLHLTATDEHNSAIQQLKETLRDRHQQLDEFRNKGTTDGDLESRINQLERNLQQRESELRLAHEEVDKQNERARQKLTEQNTLLADRQREIESLQDRVSRQGNLRTRVDELESLLRASERDLEESRNQGNAAKVELESRVEDLNQMLASQERELSGLRNELATVDHLQSKIVELENSLATQTQEIEELEGSKAHAEELQEKVHRLESEPTPLDHTEELDQLRRELQASREELNHANEELEAALTLMDAPRFAETDSPLPTHQFTVEDAATDEPVRFGFNSSPLQADDLKLIKGVGKVMEQKLHEYGVYRFQQIGQWTDTVIEDFTDNLPFGNRVTRDNWVSQAQELHREKYGQAV